MLKLCRMLRRLAHDERGFVVSAELVLILTLLVCALVVGWHAVSRAVVTELTDVAGAIGALDQSYSYPGLVLTYGGYGWAGTWYGGCVPHCAGSYFIDGPDLGDNAAVAEVGLVGWSGGEGCVSGGTAPSSRESRAPTAVSQPDLQVPLRPTPEPQQTAEPAPCPDCPRPEAPPEDARSALPAIPER